MHAADPRLVSRYFDHGATSFPKPSAVARAVAFALDHIGGTYGRSAHEGARRASAVVFDARERVARLLGTGDSSRIAFSQNATTALNAAIQSHCRSGGAVMVSPLEHNAVMRPIEMMCRRHGARYELLPARQDGVIEPEAAILPKDVRLVVCTAQSNVNGARQPIAALKRRIGELPLLVDAAQGAGELPMDVERDGIDMVAITGHKSLLGPTGVGALYVRPGLHIEPLAPGGTGSSSASFEQPREMPDALESGTPNIAGLAGLAAALEFIEQHGIADPRKLAMGAIDRLETIPGFRVLRALRPEDQGGLVSFVSARHSPSHIALELDRRYGIAVRAGLHCAPLAHRHLRTLDKGGTTRLSFGRFHCTDDVYCVCEAIAEIERERP